MHSLNLKTFAFSLALVSGTLSFAQTGPGGVGDNTTAPFWLDAHTMGGTNGAAISSWTDYSGNANHAVEADALDQPFFIENSINGRDAIDFQASQCLTAGASSAMNSLQKFKFFIVANVDNPNILSIPFNVDYGSAGADNAFSGILTQSGALDVYGRRYSSLIRSDINSPSGVHIYGGSFDMDNNELISETDFTQDDINTALLRNTSANHQEFWIGGTNSAGASHYFFDGQIAEVFVFSADLNSAEQNILENYISAKYDVAATNDMYASQAIHGLGVIGIGQEDVANSHTDSQGNGYVRISNPDDLNDGEYLFVGHDDLEIDVLSTNVPSVLLNTSRLTRQWMVEKTGDLGNITLVFDLDAGSNFSSDPSNYSLLVDGDADMGGTIDQIVTGTYNAGDETVTFTNVDLQTGDFFTLAGDSPVAIESITTGNWNTSSTWNCDCIPNSFNEVSILTGHDVTVDADAFVNELYIDGELTMDTDFNLNVFSYMEVDLGVLDLTAGKLVMAGSSDQDFDLLGGTHTIHDFEVNNTGGGTVTMHPAQISLEGSLLMEQGDLFIDNSFGGILIISSDAASGGGRIGEIKTGCTITGNVRVDRFIAAGNADYRNMTSPITNGTLDMWDATISISGEGFPDGCAYGEGGCFYSVKRYYQGDYHDVTDINASLDPGVGYEVFIGTDLTTWNGGSVSVTGVPHPEGDVVVNVLNDWNSLGNPYASPILFPNIDRNHVDNYFYIYDASTGDYQWYDGSSNTASITALDGGLLASGQGFWTFDYGTLTYDQTDKVDLTATFIRSSQAEDKGIYFTFKENSSTFETTISFEEFVDAVDGFDTLRDVRHFNLGDAKAPNVAINTYEELLRKNWISTNMREKSFDLFTEFKNDGYYTVEAANLNAFTSYNRIYLLDKETGEFIDMKKTTEYVFYADAGEVDRFRILMSNEIEFTDAPIGTARIDETTENVNITQIGNVIDISSMEYLGENIEVSVFNMLGQREVFFKTTSILKGSNLVTLPSDLKGVHVISVNVNGERISKKLVF
jgi:hypothetical protein